MVPNSFSLASITRDFKGRRQEIKTQYNNAQIEFSSVDSQSSETGLDNIQSKISAKHNSKNHSKG